MAYNWDNSMTVTIEKWDELLKELADYTYQTYIGATTDYYTEIADKLRPCPFCGSEDVEINSVTIGERESSYIFCNGCGAYVEFEFSDHGWEETIELWNRRAK